MSKNILRNVVTFLAIFMVVNFIFTKFVAPPAATPGGDPLKITTTKTEYGQNALVGITIENNTDANITIPNDCPGEPLDVLTYTNAQWQQVNV